MGLRDDVKRGVDNTADAVDEAKHRAAAEAEKLRRETAGDVMTPGEKAKSAIDEAGHRVAAGVDHLKQDIRKKP